MMSAAHAMCVTSISGSTVASPSVQSTRVISRGNAERSYVVVCLRVRCAHRLVARVARTNRLNRFNPTTVRAGRVGVWRMRQLNGLSADQRPKFCPGITLLSPRGVSTSDDTVCCEGGCRKQGGQHVAVCVCVGERALAITRPCGGLAHEAS